jgi:hypothetical protein
VSAKVVIDSGRGPLYGGRAVRPGTRGDTRRAVAATLAGASVHLYLQVHMLLTLPGFSFHRFKMYYSFDQMSYLGIATNVANGHSGSTEPFTESGVSYYPRLYYVVMGLLSRAGGVDPVVMWWLMGLTIQLVLASFIGWALYVTTQRWWAPILAPLPFLVGTFAGVLQGGFLSRTPAGAVLWGPFALMFPLNGGTAGVSLAACAVLGLLIAGWGGFRLRPTMLAGTFAAVCLGVVGNMQTYSFIGLCYVLLYSTALYGLQSQQGRRRWLLPAVSATLLAAILLAGTALAAHIGPLPLFVLGLLPALPGYLVLCRRTSWRLLWVTLLGVVLALPTTVDTLLGVAAGDPFLVYRQGSTATMGWLGVPITTFLGRGAVAVLLLLILALVPHAKSRLIRSYALGALLAWSMLSFNDHWGPSQEPNRFWTDEFMLVLVTGFPLLVAVAMGALLEARRRPATRPSSPEGTSPHTDPHTRQGTRQRPRPATMVTAVTGVAVVVWMVTATVSARDWLVFNDAARTKGVTWWPSPRSAAIESAVSAMPADGIVVSDMCTDLLDLKAITGARVATYNRGLAWPARYRELAKVQADRRGRRLDSTVARAAGVEYLLTDSHCAMPVNARGAVQPVTSSGYVDAKGKPATLRLWKINA